MKPGTYICTVPFAWEQAVLIALGVVSVSTIALYMVLIWREKARWSRAPAGPIVGFRIGGRVYHPEDVVIIRQPEPGHIRT